MRFSLLSFGDSAPDELSIAVKSFMSSYHLAVVDRQMKTTDFVIRGAKFQTVVHLRSRYNFALLSYLLTVSNKKV